MSTEAMCSYESLLVGAGVDQRVDEGRAPKEDGGRDVQPWEVVAGRHWVENFDETRW